MNKDTSAATGGILIYALRIRMSHYQPCCVKVRFLLFGLLLCCLPVNPNTALALEDTDTLLSHLLKERIESPPLDERLVCRGKLICAAAFIPAFYAQRSYRPAWTSEGNPLPPAIQLVSSITASNEEGLHPEDYHLNQLKQLMTMASTPQSEDKKNDLTVLADLDLLLTDAFLLLGSHLLGGRVNPETLDASWETQTPGTDLAAVLKDALEKDTLPATLSSLSPQRDGYKRMKKALVAYKKLSENPCPPPIPPGPSLKLGNRDNRIPALRNQLVFWGDRPAVPYPQVPELFDWALDAALRRFQARNGMAVDGVLGAKTLIALNCPVTDRISQIEINMERWRWMPHQLGTQYILVNTADFSLRLVAGLETLMEMRVVAGRPAQLTPVLSSKINYLVINPYWHVPHSIAVRDILPKLRKNPGYLREQHMTLLESWRENAPEISPESVDWTGISAHNFRYKLRQEPGAKNALGRIKFMFPNKFGVYLHDTPSRGLFKKTTRGFSSGCIRIEKPLDLAAYLLRDTPEWNYEAIAAQMESGETRVIPVNPPMPVHLLYLTAWVDENNTVQFRNDIYGRDESLKRALAETAPLPTAAKR
jgi:murein L,D-transpeptidase YcbB/YkuD